MDAKIRIRTSSHADPVTMILMHGLGSDERDMYGLAEVLHPGLEIMCIRAPHSYGPGYSWFSIDWTPDGIRINVDELKSSVEWIAGIVQSMPADQLVIGGFSQGGMMTLGMMTWFPDLFTHAAILSGRPLDGETMNPAFGGPIFHAHGIYDEVIPISEARRLSLALQAKGDRYEYHEYPIGHSIDMPEVEHFNAWAERVLFTR